MEHTVKASLFLTCLTARRASACQDIAIFYCFFFFFLFQQGYLGIRLRVSFTRPAIGLNALPSNVAGFFQARHRPPKEHSPPCSRVQAPHVSCPLGNLSWAALLSRLLGSNPAIITMGIVGVDSLQIASRAAFRVSS